MQGTHDMAHQLASNAVSPFCLVDGYGIQPTPVAVITSHRGRNNLAGLSSDENEIVNFEFCVDNPCRVIVWRIVREHFLPKRDKLRTVNLVVKANVHSSL